MSQARSKILVLTFPTEVKQISPNQIEIEVHPTNLDAFTPGYIQALEDILGERGAAIFIAEQQEKLNRAFLLSQII